MDNKQVGTNPKKAAEEKDADVIESIVEIYSSGIHRLAEIQRKGLEIAVEHNAEVGKTWKQFTPAAPTVLMLDLAATALERFADTQKSAIDLMVQQTDTFAKIVRERKATASDSIKDGKARAKEVIEHSIAAQKTALDYTAKQAKTAFETAKQQLGYAGTPAGVAADSVQRGVEVVVEAQKELLDELVASTLH